MYQRISREHAATIIAGKHIIINGEKKVIYRCHRTDNTTYLSYDPDKGGCINTDTGRREYGSKAQPGAVG